MISCFDFFASIIKFFQLSSLSTLIKGIFSIYNKSHKFSKDEIIFIEKNQNF